MSDAALILLEGSEGWLARQRERLRAEAADWVPIRPDERTPGRMYEELRSYSFFGEPRTVFIERIDQLNKEERLELSEALRAIAPKTTVILTALAGKLKDPAALFAEVAVDVQKEPATSGRAAVEQAASETGVALSPDLRSLLDEAFATEPLRLQRELEKLALLDPDGPADVGHWKSISALPGVVDGWLFARAVLDRDLGQADAILQSWREQGGGSHTAGRDLLGAVSWVLRQMMQYKIQLVRTGNAREAARAVVGRFSSADQKRAGAWSLPQLAAALDELRDLDRKLKRSSVPADRLLFDWCVRRCV
ncbi:MAG: hypothetical protein D6761_00485 [Candidatus Dadabacteria bacterium]|nr:MAG: hypothetical protein D6761_00485 [Candidatus Dadabacteria bacterium]